VTSVWLSNFLLLAQQPEGGAGPGSSPFNMLLPFAVIGVLFYFLLLRPQRKDQATRSTMLANLKKNDHVLTSGGIYGVVTNVRREADEVTIKVDEATNTKLRITLSSVVRVIGGEEPVPEKETK